MTDYQVSDEELALVIPILQRLVWADVATREKLQAGGIDVIPGGFYSSIPSIAEIKQSFEYTEDLPPYLNSKLFDAARFATWLHKLIPFAAEFNPPIAGSEQNCRQFFWENSQFSYSDAMSYYTFVRLLRPKRIIEIGAGFSTLVALEALASNESGSITCIEPYPRDFLQTNNTIELKTIPAQELQPDFLNANLNDGDVLFIDSTHTVKSGSDCLHLYLRLLPQIKRDIYVHVHDVFLPFGLPQSWLLQRQIFWTEQYLLMAWLLDNPKTELIYGSSFNAMQHPELLTELMGNKYPIGGGSVWFHYKGS